MTHLSPLASLYFRLGVVSLSLFCSIAHAQVDPMDAANAAMSRCGKVLTTGPVQKRNPEGVKCIDRATASLNALMNQSLEALTAGMKPASLMRLNASQQKWREFGVEHFAVLDAMAADDPTNTEVQIYVAMERFSHVTKRATQLFAIESFPKK